MYRRSGKVLLGRLTATRSITYKLPTIATLETIKSKNQDFKGLFSNHTIDELWFGRGTQLVSGLNHSLEQSSAEATETTEQTEVHGNNLLELVAQTIRKPELYGVYAYSSLLYNLQFFLESLKEGSTEIIKSQPNDLLKSPITQFINVPTDELLSEWISSSFGSIEEFRTLFLNSAAGIKGDGMVWLVAESTDGSSTERQEVRFTKLSIVNTYNTGVVDDSLRSGQWSRLQQQKKHKLAQTKEQQGEEIEEVKIVESDIDRLTLGTAQEAEYNKLYHGKQLLPVLAIDASMRNYVLDYGVYGKQQYLNNVWECIDWDVVLKRLPERTKVNMPTDIL